MKRHPLPTTCYGLITIFILLAYGQAGIAQNSYRLSKAPFYKTFNKKVMVSDVNIIARLPITIDRQTSEEFFYQGRLQILAPLLIEINHYLGSLPWSPPIPGAPF